MLCSLCIWAPKECGPCPLCKRTPEERSPDDRRAEEAFRQHSAAYWRSRYGT